MLTRLVPGPALGGSGLGNTDPEWDSVMIQAAAGGDGPGLVGLHVNYVSAEEESLSLGKGQL